MDITNSIITQRNILQPYYGHENFSSDYILPEYYPDINKIISYSFSPFVEEITVTNGKISVSSSVIFSLLYQSSDDKISNFEAVLKYTKIFQSEDFTEKSCVNVTQELISENVRATGPKRININGTIEIKVNTSFTCETEFISDISEKHVESLEKKIDFINFTHNRHKTIVYKETINIPENENLDAIIKSDCHCIVKEKRVIKGKVYLSGEYRICILYLTTDCKVKSFTHSVPLSEVVDCAGTEENDLCYLAGLSCFIKTDFADNSEGKIINAEIVTNFILITGNQKETKYIKDAYSLNSELKLQHATSDFTEAISENNRLLDITFKKDINYSINEVIAPIHENTLVSCEKRNNNNVLIFDIIYKLLIKNSTGDIISVSEKYTYEHVTDISEFDDIILVSVNPSSCEALHIENNSVQMNFKIDINYLTIRHCKENIITDISSDKDTDCNSDCGIVLYFAQKNESVWEIAKANRSPLKQVCSINNIDINSVSEDIMLILPKI